MSGKFETVGKYRGSAGGKLRTTVEFRERKTWIEAETSDGGKLDCE